MSSPSITELIRRSVEFPSPSLRIASLAAALIVVEEQLDHLKGQRSIRLYARLRSEGKMMAQDDVEYEKDELKRTVEALFPKLFRGGFIMSLWSVFEVCIKGIAEYVRHKKELPFGLQELRAGDFLQQTTMFFEKVLDIKTFPNKAVHSELKELQGLRNCLAHHDGNIEGLPNFLRNRTESKHLQKGLLIFDDLHHKYVVPTAKYADDNFKIVRAYLEEFADKVYAKIHPIPLEDDA